MRNGLRGGSEVNDVVVSDEQGGRFLQGSEGEVLEDMVAIPSLDRVPWMERVRNLRCGPREDVP
jgi:hypothetical protein